MAGNGNEPDTTHASVGQFDDIDETILSMLEKDGRATLSQLSDATGLSISAVQSRVQKLERRNVILGYKAVIDDEKRGLAVRAYIAVNADRLFQGSRDSRQIAGYRRHHVVRFRGWVTQLHADRARSLAKQA